MNENDVGPKETLVIEVPDGAPRSAASAIEDARSIDDSWDTDDPATDIRPQSGGHFVEPATMARPAASQGDEPKTFISRPGALDNASGSSANEAVNDADAPNTTINRDAPDDDAARTIINSSPNESAPRSLVNQAPNDEDAPKTYLNLTNEDEDPATALRPLAERASNPPSLVAPMPSPHATIQMPQQPAMAPTPPPIAQSPLATPLPMPRPPTPPSHQLGSFAVGALAGLVALFLVGAVTAGYLLMSHRNPQHGKSIASAMTQTALAKVDATSVPSQSSPTEEPSGALASASPSAETTAFPVVSGSADEQAKAALARLRDGINDCVKNTIHLLPGTSTPVPNSIAWLKHGPYASTLHDWVGPFFSCTKFKSADPIPFMIQWQLEKPGDHGNAIAWIDSNQDGKADRAYGFSARLKEHGVVEFGEIGPVDPNQKPAKH